MISLYVAPGTGFHDSRLPPETWLHFKPVGTLGVHDTGEQEHIFALAVERDPSGQMAITYQEKQPATVVGTMVPVEATFQTMVDGGDP
jgi:hypothetical protein